MSGTGLVPNESRTGKQCPDTMAIAGTVPDYGSVDLSRLQDTVHIPSFPVQSRDSDPAVFNSFVELECRDRIRRQGTSDNLSFAAA